MEQTLPPVPDLRIGPLFSRAWRAFKTRPWFLVGAYLASALLTKLLLFSVGFAMVVLFAGRPAVHDVFFTLCMGLNFVLSLGLLAISLRLWTGRPASFDMLFTGFRKFWPAVGLWLAGYVFWTAMEHLQTLLSAFAASRGIENASLVAGLALAVPGSILAVALSPAPLVLLETPLGLVPSLRMALDLTLGHRWQLFFVLLASLVFGLSGLLAFGVGLLITIPVSQILLVGAFNELVQAYAKAGDDPAIPAQA